MSDAARSRLAHERKELLENKPAGCYARPCKRADGSTDLMYWEAGITPLQGSAFALPQSGSYRLFFEFPADFPGSPPLVRFSPAIFHTNCWQNGNVCMSLLLAEGHHPGKGHKGHWQATLTLAEILKAMQVFLDEPNAASVCVLGAGSLGRHCGAPLPPPPPTCPPLVANN
jgi:ubiquitin-conjugating enzyme E2 I